MVVTKRKYFLTFRGWFSDPVLTNSKNWVSFECHNLPQRGQRSIAIAREKELATVPAAQPIRDQITGYNPSRILGGQRRTLKVERFWRALVTCVFLHFSVELSKPVRIHAEYNGFKCS
ncbi:hypothetical protein TNCT_363951 [Trichonephila clavata]|uniref:Uncharacterized protein n=1 Tax=Trichonephila clavata TaxID=2740835 RepID=A0A8X6GZF7_TRICU|nr:hypothetical protein TNCT_363951 [Trichonephila clavata]